MTQVSFGGYSFKVTENGTKLVFGEQAFAVGEKSIRVAKDGKARSE